LSRKCIKKKEKQDQHGRAALNESKPQHRTTGKETIRTRNMTGYTGKNKTKNGWYDIINH
jgi:hypothetical protein